jgi:signal transduction histidine kinase/CheY-like chemotaxis protein
LLKTLTALKKGNFSIRLPNDWTGVNGKIADTLNDVIEMNERLVKELERISRVVGREGKITQRAAPPAADGSWVSLIESVNTLIDDLAQPTTEMARVIGAVAHGDLSQTMAPEVDGRPLKGEFLRLVKLVNAMVTQLGSFASEVTRVAREVGTEGKLGGEAKVKGVAGTWKDLTDSVNFMAGNLTAQVRNIAEVTTAVAKGDLSKKITVDVKGEILELKNTINTMVDQLNSFAYEVTSVVRDVGTEGKLGGQARVAGVGGVWKDLTDSVNSMGGNLTAQVRNIAEVTTAVANGDLSKKITVDVKGEILELKDTINVMVDQLNSFASEVTRVAREVGTDGKLGGQAQVPGIGGTWKDLTDSVNFMAGNLTSQVRNIAEVTTAVANGDLSKKITVDVKGEILELKNTINRMVDQLNAIEANTRTDLQRHAAALEQEIADRKRAEKERAESLLRAQAAQAKAEEANRLKDEFLATVSHELRAPLTAMLGWVALIRGERLDKESKERAMETVERNTRAQKKLVDDLLDVSSIVTGNFSLDIEPIDLASVIESAVESVRPEAEAKGVRLQKNLDPAGHMFLLDPNRFQQVIWNLVQNAVKFTPAGGAVEIRLRYPNGQAEIEVIDTGVGIAPEFLPFVFDRFRQANGSITRIHGGLGLGLTIARSLVEMHGGTVVVESAGEGKGTTFKITLPPPLPEELPREAPPTAETGPETMALKLSGLRVLVVDDQVDMRELLATILCIGNADVRSAGGIDEAMSIMTDWSPEILICDIAMPGGSGYELIRRVRDGGCNTPAIAITARAGREDSASSLAAGFQMHMPKPIEPPELVANIASLTGRLT